MHFKKVATANKPDLCCSRLVKIHQDCRKYLSLWSCQCIWNT